MDDGERSRLGALFAAKTSTAPSSDCTLWNGATIRGYGAIHTRGVVQYAHRVSWEMKNGPIPEGMYIDHACYTPACVNPSHLRVATPSQNIGNRSGASRNSLSGVRGVHWDKSRKRWMAQVTAGGKVVLKRRFDTLAEAKDAAASARAEAFGEFAGNS